MRFGHRERNTIYILQEGKEMTVKQIAAKLFEDPTGDQEREVMRVIRNLEKKGVVSTRMEKNLSARKNSKDSFIYRKLISLR